MIIMIIINYVLRYVCQFHSISVIYKLANSCAEISDHNRLLTMIGIDQIFVDALNKQKMELFSLFLGV